jgi:hypothetical protein
MYVCYFPIFAVSPASSTIKKKEVYAAALNFTLCVTYPKKNLFCASCSLRKEVGGKDQRINSALKLHGCLVMLLFIMHMVVMKW